MLEKIKKTTKYTVYSIIIIIVLSAYFSNQSEINNFSSDLWQTFKRLVSSFAVVPEYQPITQAQDSQKEEQKITHQQKIDAPLSPANITYTIKQTKAGKQFSYGYDGRFRLVGFIDGERKTIIEYTPEEKIYKIISGDKIIKFGYNQRAELMQITSDEQVTKLRYDLNGWLKSFETPYEKLTFLFDSAGRLMTYRRGEGYETKFTYNKNKLNSFLKDGTTTKLAFNQKGQLKSAVTDDDNLIINYGKDDLISYFAGTKYGLGETISYNTNDETITSATDDSQFTGETETARITALNLYLTCTKFKKVPVLFDPLAYVIYTSYFKEDIISYLTNNFVCDDIYAEKRQNV